MPRRDPDNPDIIPTTLLHEWRADEFEAISELMERLNLSSIEAVVRHCVYKELIFQQVPIAADAFEPLPRWDRVRAAAEAEAVPGTPGSRRRRPHALLPAGR